MPSGYAPGPRPCHRCLVVKVADRFPLGRARKRRSSVCWACWEEEAWAQLARVERRRTTRIVNGRRRRRCPVCGIEKPLTRQFFYVKPPGGQDHRGYKIREPRFFPLCKECHNARNARYDKRKRADRVKGAGRRAGVKAAAKRYRERHPERVAAAGRAWKERLKADPVRWAQYLEDQRINYRLRAERNGRQVKAKIDSRMAQATTQPEASGYLPAEPLAAFVCRLIERRELVEGIVEHGQKGAQARVCKELGISSRTLRRWTAGEATQVRFGVAAQIVALGADGDWAEVYSYDDHRDLYERVLTGVA